VEKEEGGSGGGRKREEEGGRVDCQHAVIMKLLK